MNEHKDYEQDLSFYVKWNEKRIKEFKKFDFVDFFKRIHTSLAADPQYAEIKDGKVIYSFLLHGPTYENGEQAYFGPDKKHLDDVVMGFTSALKTIYPELISIEVNPRKEKDYESEMEVIYTPENKEELNKILNYLRTVKIDGDKLPKKDDTFFGYD